MFKNFNNGEKVFYNNKKYKNYDRIIREKEYVLIKNLKNDNRSYVSLIEINGEKLIYKIPKEKNENKWQRFLSIFRGGESEREFKNCEKILKNNFYGPKPIFYKEICMYGMVISSYLLMEYIDGEIADYSNENIKKISNLLKIIHERGFLHGDAQLSNFMLKDNKVYLIDCKLKKKIFGKYSEFKEFIYLEKSCYKNIDGFNKHDIMYKIAKKIDEYTDLFNYFTKKIRRKIN